MLRHEFAVVIRRPVEEVFAYVTDLPRTGEWRTTVLEVGALERQGSSAVGARFRSVTRVAGRRWNWLLEVTQWEPPQVFAYTVVEGSAPMVVEYRLEQHLDGALFTMVASLGAIDGAFWRLVVPAISWGMQREVRQHLRNLQRVMEDS